MKWVSLLTEYVFYFIPYMPTHLSLILLPIFFHFVIHPAGLADQFPQAPEVRDSKTASANEGIENHP